MESFKILSMNGITDVVAEKSCNPKGATKNEHIRLSFDRRLALEFHGAKVSSDAGLLAYREMDEVLGLTSMGGRLLNDWRTGKNTQHSMLALVRQSIYSRLAGYEDNKVRLHLFVLAYNLGNCLRQLVLPREIKRWTLTTTREKLIKIGAKAFAMPAGWPSSWPRWRCPGGYSLRSFVRSTA